MYILLVNYAHAVTPQPFHNQSVRTLSSDWFIQWRRIEKIIDF